MKKIVVLLIIFSFFNLSACGTKETLDQKTVLTNATEAVETLDSYTVDMTINADTMGMETTMEGSGDITHNPDTMHLNMSMGMPGMSLDFEVYVHEEEAYMSMFGEWIIMDTEEMGLESFDQLNKEEMQKLVEYSDQFKMTEEDDLYVLTLTGEGEEYTDLVEELVQSSMGEDLTMEEAFQTIQVNNLNLTIRMDKESFIPMSESINADLEVDGESMQLNGEFDISNINKIEPIVIPDEVKENAVEEEFMGEFDQEEPMSIEEIQELVDYEIPQVTDLPEGYTQIDSWYDDMMEVVMIDYEKDDENGFSLSIYPSKEDYGEMIEEETTETVTINGNDGTFSDMDDIFILTWEQNGQFLELWGWGTELKKDNIIKLAESVQ